MIRAVSLDEELLVARNLGAGRSRRTARIIVVEVELTSVLHGDCATVRASRADHGVVAELHRTAANLDVGRVRQRTVIQRDRTGSFLHETTCGD